MGAVPGAHARGGKGAFAQTAPKPAENGRRASHGTARWLHDDCHHASELTYEISGLAEIYLKAPEVTRRNTRVHFIQPLKERIVREVGYGLSLEGASAADLIKSKK